MQNMTRLKAEDGDIVRVHYTLTLEDGSIFDSSTGELPFEFMIGRGTVFPAFENAVIGMGEGQTKRFTVPPEKAYGCYRDDLVYVIEKHLLPHDITPEEGMMLTVDTAEGKKIDALVTDIDALTVKCDANHELAGKALSFEIRLLKIIRPG
jgi:peptidylprolyl isomerase